MNEQVSLLRSLPKTVRDVKGRALEKNAQVKGIALMYGQEYFDGDRKYGYGGYYDDGRWSTVAADIIRHYLLGDSAIMGDGARVLDIGCAKGFLVKELCNLGIDAYGLDISKYAVRNCPPEVVGRLHVGTAANNLPFPDNSFDLVLSINTLHNLERETLKFALQEIMRVTRKYAFVQVDSYLTPRQKARFEEWVLTAQYVGYPDDWLKLFKEAGYTGDYDWTTV